MSNMTKFLVLCVMAFSQAAVGEAKAGDFNDCLEYCADAQDDCQNSAQMDALACDGDPDCEYAAWERHYQCSNAQEECSDACYFQD